MAQYYKFESIQFESKNVPLGEINYAEFTNAKIMIRDEISLESKESLIEWIPENKEYEEQLYWIYSYQHIYSLINKTIKKLLIEMRRATYIFELNYNIEINGFSLSFVNHYQNIRFYFNLYLMKLFEMFKYKVYNENYYVIDTTINTIILSETRYIKIPPRSYFIRINGKKLIEFDEDKDLHNQFIFYDAKPKEVIYLKNNHSIAIFCKINNNIYHLKGIEHEIAYSEL